MLSISAVVATDVNSTDDVISGDVDDDLPSDVLQNSSTNDDVEAPVQKENYVLDGDDVNKYYKQDTS